MKLRVLVVGRGGNAWADEAVHDYAKRTRRWGGIEEIAVRAEPFHGQADAVRRAEAERVLKQVGDRDRLVVLDERGDDVDTAAWTGIVEQARNDGVARLTYAIGGAYGHDPAVRARAHRVVRLSSLVLNHEVARVVLYEQLYRALAAVAGVPYAH